MTLTFEIAPEIEAALTEKARRRGLALNAYLVDAALRDESGDSNNAVNARLTAWNAFVANAPTTRRDAGFGPLPAAALERDSIYEGEGRGL